jgi:hypothetical protein
MTGEGGFSPHYYQIKPRRNHRSLKADYSKQIQSIKKNINPEII